MRRIAILTEAGGSVGFGHLTRCEAIYESCSNTSLLVQQEGEEKFELPLGAQSLSWRKRPDSIFQLGKWDAILVDSYLADRSVLEGLRTYTPLLAVLDDYERMIYPCDLIINPSIQGPDYKDQLAKIEKGADYVILRKEIRNHASKSSHGPLRRLVISLGGANKIDLFLRLLPVLAQLELELLVLSGSQQSAEELSIYFQQPNIHVFGRLSAPKVTELFTSSDLAISAGGQTLNELAFLGVPFLTIETGTDQHWNIHSYVSAGVSPVHYMADDPNLEPHLIVQINAVQDVKIREDMSKAGLCFIDGAGGARICGLLS